METGVNVLPGLPNLAPVVVTPPLVTPPTVPPAVAWPAGVSQPPTNLPYDDGDKLESNWHRDAMNLLVELIRFLFWGRTDYFVGGNMFIYYSWRQIRNADYRGPDFFFVKNVDGNHERVYWATWDEDGRYPNVIIELTSPSTAAVDLTTKKDIYQQIFRTPEYFIYDPATERLQGWRLTGDLQYRVLEPNEQGWLWSEEIGVWLGTWRGQFQGHLEHVWPRFYDRDGQLVPLFAEDAAEKATRAQERAKKEKEQARKEKERANAEKERANAEKERANAEKEQANAEKERANAEKEQARKEKERANAEKTRADKAEAALAKLQAILAAKGLPAAEENGQ